MKRILLVLFLFQPFWIFAQNSELAKHLDALKNQVGEVEGEKLGYRQEISYEAATPFRLEVVTKEVDKKGKTTEKRAVLNLGLLDKNLVRRENSKDLMWVSVRSGGMPVIKMFQDGTQTDYSNSLQFYCKNVDNARAIEEALKAAIPLAEAAWKKSVSLPSDLLALRTWFANYVKNVDVGDASYKQTLELDPQHPAQTWLTVETFDSKGLKKSEKLGWDLGDLHEPSVKVQIRKKLVAVEATVRQNQSFISNAENGELKGFTKSLTIYAEDVDQGQLLARALQEMIPLARAASEKLLPKPASLKEGLQLLGQQVKNFNVNQNSYEQSVAEAQLTTYTRRTPGQKASVEEKFVFDFSDLADQAITIKPVKQLFEVEVPTTGKQTYIEAWKNGEQQSYAQKLEFFAADLATAKHIQHLLSYVIKSSSRTISPQNLAWITTTLAGFDEQQLDVRQKLELRDGESCKVSLSTFKEKDKKVDEHLFEFNLYDIDPDKLSLNVKGKTVMLALPTRFSESIIKDYVNGGKINYTKEVSMVVPSIETGKVVLATLQKIAKECAKK